MTPPLVRPQDIARMRRAVRVHEPGGVVRRIGETLAQTGLVLRPMVRGPDGTGARCQPPARYLDVERCGSGAARWRGQGGRRRRR